MAQPGYGCHRDLQASSHRDPGITVAASLTRRRGSHTLDITLVEPSDTHYYQPAFTLVGAGTYQLDNTRRAEASLIPAGVNWVRQAAAGFDPDKNRISLGDGSQLDYDYLVVCPGLELNWDAIAGVSDALGIGGVCSNYSPDHVEYTWECVQALEAGQRALFTQPPLPFKCPGAPQKIAYLAADYLRKKGLLEQCDLHFLNHGGAMFGVPYFARELDKVMARYGINVHFATNLVAVDGAARSATFDIVGSETGEQLELEYDLLHVTPPQRPPEFVRDSVLADATGYVEVDHNSMRHVRFGNIFALGDAGCTPNSKTAAAVRKQAPVVVRNILNSIDGAALESGYDGYGSCPLTTAYGKVMLAEFCYGGKVTPTFPLDPKKERSIMWWVKQTGLPIMYWDYMLKGHEWFFRHDTGFDAGD